MYWKRLVFLWQYFDDRWNVFAKSAQYLSGEYVGIDGEGNLCKGIIAFMVVGLK